MFLNFGRNANMWHSFFGLIYIATLLCYSVALEDLLSGAALGFTFKNSRREPTEGNIERPTQKACSELEKDAPFILTPHSLIGTAADPTEFPFMAALGYSQNKSAPYDFRCGGTLIHNRFVLTAALCFALRIPPSIVRLGMSDLDDPQEVRNRMDVPIKAIYIHPGFSLLDNINNIALIELENPVSRSHYIKPTCLYTSADLTENTSVLAVGWGVIDNTNEKKSNKQVKNEMKILSNSKCRQEQLFEPSDMHLCASNNVHNLCMGGSGGPLIIVEDESAKQYRQVGIITFDFDCGSSTPDVFTKVSSYLDYIESIVWP